MATITQDIHFRLSLIRYAEKHGVTKAALTYHVNRQYIYRWKNRFDGSPDSLRYRSRKPHSHRKDNERFYPLIPSIRLNTSQHSYSVTIEGIIITFPCAP